MKNVFRYIYRILGVLAVLVLVGCADDGEVKQMPREVRFCVRTAWQNGLGTQEGKAGGTRALSATDILAPGTEDIVINTEDYPATINMHCSDGEDFTLTKDAACHDHEGYWSYTTDKIYKDIDIQHEELTFDATAVIDDAENEALSDRLEGRADKNDIRSSHLLLTLHHTKALLRFAFRLSEKYNNVRQIVVTDIQLNGEPCYLVNKVLEQSNQFIAYAYIDPSAIGISTLNRIQCTYNIYDRAATFTPAADGTVTQTNMDANAAYVTRKDAVAQNVFTLNTLRDANSSPVTQIRTGYYYDLIVTLNPDFLYVMSANDNDAHMTIE